MATDPEKVKTTIRGKIVSIDTSKRAMLVRNEEEQAEYPLKWEPVMDVICQKEKPNNRVEIVTLTDMTKPDPQSFIISVKFDETYRKKKDAYASPQQGNEILIQSCLRIGAEALEFTNQSKGKNFDDTMDMLMNRAIKDARRIKAEAKKL